MKSQTNNNPQNKEDNIMTRNFFENATTLEDVKALYKKYARELHPDCNPGKDTTAEFQEMQKQYEATFNRCKNIHINKDGEQYTKETEETPEMFAGIINALLKLDGLCIELCGSWLWITGNTYEHRAELKALNFKYSGNKKAWYFHFEPYRKHSKKSVDLDTIRDMYGSQRFSGKTETVHKEIEKTA
jgi:curved DNA-binding protein CbpA